MLYVIGSNLKPYSLNNLGNYIPVVPVNVISLYLYFYSFFYHLDLVIMVFMSIGGSYKSLFYSTNNLFDAFSTISCVHVFGYSIIVIKSGHVINSFL